MTDREDRPLRGPTEEIRPTEPFLRPARRGTTSPLRFGGSRSSVPGRWMAVALVVVVVFGVGFFIGRGQTPDTQVRDRVERRDGQGDGQGQGGQRQEGGRRRRACRQALDLALQERELFRQALDNRRAFIEALVSEDADAIQALAEAGRALEERAAQVQAQFDEALATCRG